MDHQVVGTVLPVLEIMLQPGETLIAEAGELSWMGPSINLQTSTKVGAPSGGFGRLKRLMGGGGLFMTEYSAQGAPGMVAFATKLPGTILPVDISPGRSYMVHRHGFLCATPGIEVTIGFQQSLGAGLFGGDGFILQRLQGESHAWVELDGEVITYDLGPGDSLRVHPGHVGMFEESVNFSITTIKGIKNKLFGGDGLFLANLQGPGKIWLQSLPVSNLAHALEPYLPKDNKS